jgi:uncharacterized protein
MSEGLPVVVDPFRLAERGQTVRGRLPVARLGRLSECLADTAGEVGVELEFLQEARSRTVVHGAVRASLRMVCQRCLEPVEVPLDVAVRLVAVRTEVEADRLDEGEDALVAVDGRVFLPDLVEDELLLAMPQVPMHPAGVCRPAVAAADGDAESDRPRPFAELAALGRARGRQDDG